MAHDRLEAVASALAYPDAAAHPALLESCAVLEGDAGFPQAAVARLRAWLEGSPPEVLEEDYTRTFDVNPLCTLEIGWHLYGEDYARGAFLVEMRQSLRALGVEEGAELPDHLPLVLRVLARLPEPKAEVFSRSFVQPALRKMVDAYPEPEAPHHGLLAALLTTLESQYGVADPAEAAQPQSQAIPYECGGCQAPPAPLPSAPGSFGEEK